MKRISLLVCFLAIYITRMFSQEVFSKKIISDFYQLQVIEDVKFSKCINDHDWGNCVTIAVIKAALSEFKTVKNIYKEYRVAGDSTYITFNDNVKIKFSRSELSVASKMAGLGKSVNSVYYDSAIIVYTSICERVLKRRMIYKNDSTCINSFINAANYVNSGYTTSAAGELLGLTLSEINRTDLKTTLSAIIDTHAHTAFCTNGKQDFLGRSHIVRLFWMRNPIGIGSPIAKAYILSKINL